MTPDELCACYTTHHRRLYLVALGITMDRQAAEDAVHDALEKLLRKSPEPANLLFYLTRTVRHAAIDLVRRRGLDNVRLDNALVNVGGAPCEISPKTLASAFAQLRRDEREAIWLHVYADLSFREIATLRRRSLNTVTSWYRRGIMRLQKILEVENESY